MRNMALSILPCALLALVACSSSSAPLNFPLVAGDVCPSDVQPPVASVESNPAIKPPEVIHRVHPPPDRDRVMSVTEATVEAIIGEDGVPRNVCVTAGDVAWGRHLAESFRQWRFRPATLDGKPIAVRLEMRGSSTSH